MNFHHEERLLGNDAVVCKIDGVLDAGTSIILEQALGEYLRNDNVKRFILEVPDLTFVSSSGLRIFMIIIKAVTPRQGRLFMVGATPQVAGLVKMSGMGGWIFLRSVVEECSIG